MAMLTTKTEGHKDVLRLVANARLEEFEALRTATPPRYATAVYLGGYAVEALLKCAICQTLKLDELPVAFHVHHLEVLLFYSGLYSELKSESEVWEAFKGIQDAWSERLRYADPSSVTRADCDDMAIWLNDSQDGIVPWLEARL